jgi:hypothetical protein
MSKTPVLNALLRDMAATRVAGKCWHCWALRKLGIEECPHRVKRVDDVMRTRVGDECDGAIIVTVDREFSTVTLEPKEIYYMPERWK